MYTYRSTKVTLWVNRVIAAAVVVLLFAMPWMLGVYSRWRNLVTSAATAIFVGYYCCAGVVLFAQWHMERLLKNILSDRVFIRENVKRVMAVRWCCLLVALICAPASVFYLPLIFMTIIMGFLGLVVSVVANVLDVAVKIREENDLTV